VDHFQSHYVGPSSGGNEAGKRSAGWKAVLSLYCQTETDITHGEEERRETLSLPERKSRPEGRKNLMLSTLHTLSFHLREGRFTLERE